VSISYARAPVAVRGDLAEAHAHAWTALAAPGTWWTGAERVAIAAETRAARDCQLCRAREHALSPAAVAGAHDRRSALPDAVIDVAHRVAGDPARLSRSWFEGIVASSLSDAHYVEMVAIVARTVSIDAFSRGIGMAPHALPEARDGEPSRHRPTAAKRGDAWVALVATADATGPEADLYGGARRPPNVMRALSLVPDDVRMLRALAPSHYVPFERVADPGYTPHGRALARPQMELIAARVSALNECFY
jgi:hypothetical protein